MASGRGWFAEKVSKVKKFDAEIARRNQDNEVWSDHFYGRSMWSPELTGRTWEQADYDRIKNQPSSHDKWVLAVCAKCGVSAVIRPQRSVRTASNATVKSAVYLDNGFRRLFDDAEAALDYFVVDDHAVKMWDATYGQYLTK